ncbi:SDR family NAD(P)-dependent oxidoreductase [Acinetobacter tandoii]|uniref:SDR family NAD(P)-dependent oxidoreductase n=1 Tax=Acinetobacter tandoii TaxID=202954 RepID=UPI0040454FE6
MIKLALSLVASAALITGIASTTYALDIEAIPDNYYVPGRFDGKTILVTGGARGIGKASAIRAAKEGANIVIADVLKNEGEETIQEIRKLGKRAVFVHADVSKTTDCDRMVDIAVKNFGQIDGVLNAAGVMDGIPPDAKIDIEKQKKQLFAPIHEATDEYWNRTMAVNATGMFCSLRSELRQMVKQNNGGAIVNIGSIAGLTGLGGNPAYVASKHAVSGLTKNAAMDYAPYGIRVNSVNMAATKTAMTQAAFKKVSELQKDRAKDPELAKIPNTSFIKSQGLLQFSDSKHREATPAEQASVILFLLSPEASNITGATWATDGGWTTF